jgi:hypothetical protein
MSDEEIKDDDFEEVELEQEEGGQEAASTGDGTGDAEEAPSGEAVEEPKKPSKFQKRIDDLVHKQREAERQRDEYYKVAQKIMDENNSLRKAAQEFSSTSVSEMEARIESDIEKAKSDYRKAYEDGDADKIIEAQDRMIKAASQNAKLDNMRSQAAPENYQPQEPIAPPPDTKALEWASRNQWFQKDMVMTNAAYAIHDDVVRSGVQASTEEYYDLIDQRIREEFPHKFQEEAQDTPSPARKGNVAQVVTPGGNESGRSKKVRLSPSQVAVAKRLGVPLEEYAKQFVALDK